MTKVTVIIPNYNGLDFLIPCLKSLRDQTFKDFSVLVVDNGSDDGSVGWLKDNLVPSLFLEKNFGFAVAANKGIEASDSPFVIMLNNDTVADAAYMENLVGTIEKSPHIFSVSPKMVKMSDPHLIDDAGDCYSLPGWGFQRGVGQDARLYDRPCTVFSSCGGGAIYRRSVLEEIGLFDERHFAYLEDIDLGYRAQIAGYCNRYCPSAVLSHVGSGTSGSRYNDFKVRLAARNNIYLIYKNMPALQLAVNLLPIIAGTIVKYFYFKDIGFGKAYLQGIKEGLSSRRETKKIKYEPGRLINYLAIEWELIAGTFTYVSEFSRRQLAKTKH